MPSVLIVDDDKIIRRMIHDLIELKETWDVCGEAGDGKQAVEQALLLHPDLVIMDVRMPVMNGFDASRLMSFCSPGTKILMISVQDSPHHSRAAEESGARGFLTKSGLVTHLATAVSALLENKTYFSHSN